MHHRRGTPAAESPPAADEPSSKKLDDGNHHTGDAAGLAAAAGAGGPQVAGASASPAPGSSAVGYTFMEPISFTSAQLTKAAFFGLASSVLTFCFVSYYQANPERFLKNDLYSGQVCVFLIGFAIWIAGAYHAALIANTLLSGEESTFTAACRRHLDDHQRDALLAANEFTALLAVFFLCDRTDVLPRSNKKYDRDQFWFVWILLMIAALFTLRKAPKPKEQPPPPQPATVTDGDKKDEAQTAQAAVKMPEVAAATQGGSGGEDYHIKWLQRDQTEEWKGWMQVMFLWYHYFEAKEIYNAIRLYIAAYVWMTGFGNFSYYYIRKDFSFERFCQMQWRLNFLVIWVCLLLANEYMLYYINMLHTYFTLLIYIGLGVWSHKNTSTQGITLKMGLLFAFSFIMWDVKGVFDLAWKPFEFLVQYHDPYRPERPVLHEWQFRSGLDHYIWIFGMITAFNHPNVDAWMVRIDSLPHGKGMAVKWACMAALLLGWYLYAVHIFALPKKEYNALHPYTSVIPITLYIFVRNLFPTLRRWHMHLFEYLGKITLETYIAQFHVWMATTGINGSPKQLLKFVPGEWPMVNFVVASAVFFVVSMRLFHNTNALKAFVLPPKSAPELLRRNLVIAAAGLAGAFVWGAIIRSMAWVN